MNALPSIFHSFYCSLTSSFFPFIFQDSALFSISGLIIIALDSPSPEVPHLPLAAAGHVNFPSPAGTQVREGISKDAELLLSGLRAACNLDFTPYHWTHPTCEFQGSFLCALENCSLGRFWCCEAAPQNSPSLWISPNKGSDHAKIENVLYLGSDFCRFSADKACFV